MQRRQVLGAVAGLGVAGCLDGRGDGTDSERTGGTTSRTSKPGSRHTVVTATGSGVRARFRIVDAGAPTDETASASFEDGRVVVTGSMDPGGCRRPTLDRVGSGDGGTVELVVAEAWRFGPTATVECDNASFDYRCVVTVESGSPSTVAVVHDHRESDDRTFTVQRE